MLQRLPPASPAAIDPPARDNPFVGATRIEYGDGWANYAYRGLRFCHTSVGLAGYYTGHINEPGSYLGYATGDAWRALRRLLGESTVVPGAPQ